MEAGASLRALHATVTGEEVAAHAEGEAVGLILADKLLRADVHDGDEARAVVLREAQLVGGVVVVEAALDRVDVRHAGVLAPSGGLVPRLLPSRHSVDLLHPLHFTITEERIEGQEKLHLA